MLDRYFFDTNIFLYSILEAKNDAGLDKENISLKFNQIYELEVAKFKILACTDSSTIF